MQLIHVAVLGSTDPSAVSGSLSHPVCGIAYSTHLDLDRHLGLLKYMLQPDYLRSDDSFMPGFRFGASSTSPKSLATKKMGFIGLTVVATARVATFGVVCSVFCFLTEFYTLPPSWCLLGVFPIAPSGRLCFMWEVLVDDNHARSLPIFPYISHTQQLSMVADIVEADLQYLHLASPPLSRPVDLDPHVARHMIQY
ncbi:hypothetical protein GGR58DRAFT_507566 [Xylaria digitata]|nr:hypothetical protein GGR58DRAFT_507566 [Xylaria digitata]